MIMRMVQARMKLAELQQFVDFYRQRVVRVFSSTGGCRYAGLMQSVEHPDECISLTLWNSEEQAQAYEKGGQFAQLLQETRPFLVESRETRIQLSHDLKIEIVPVPEEPTVTSMPVTVRGEKIEKKGGQESIWVRIVSLKLRPGMKREFERLYREQSIPLLQSIKGCRYVYLVDRSDRQDEMLSVTSWDSKKDADEYEEGGHFKKLIMLQQHLFSDLYQWKVLREQQEGGGVATSEDVGVEHYNVLVSQSFA